ncbi:MAG TPA: carboxylating nicotinate-nucleotide diphosphorylase [Acidimicrobiales bacterium]|nr:carboxylating nicotinate-nucleotide diphosphorylase [Acidimicrobiales bacterium]
MSDVHPPLEAVRAVVRAALAEDLLPMGDITASLVPGSTVGSARFVARQPGVISGVRSAHEAFRQVDDSVEVRWQLDDSIAVRPGDVVGSVRGPLRSILTAERTALNLLCHLSGIATFTRRYVDAVSAADQRCRVRDTRKTTPGLRALEKAAVRAGGGVNHRANLSESILIKDNHLGGLSVTEAVTLARQRWPGRHVEVECDDADQLKVALDAGADMVLLDNMTPDQVAACVETVRAVAPETPVEVSGRVSLEAAPAYARAGADFVSIGSITHSAPVLDIGLDLD